MNKQQLDDVAQPAARTARTTTNTDRPPPVPPRRLPRSSAAPPLATGSPDRRPEPAREAPQRQLGGYELLCTIATGGVSQLFVARRRDICAPSEVVAVKCLAPVATCQPELRRAFYREALVHARMSHPGIPQLHEHYLSGSSPHYAMQYVDGINLRDLWRQAVLHRRQFPLGVALSIVRDAAAALQYTHEHRATSGDAANIVHGNVCPSNLLLGRDGQLKLIDFGAATIAGQGGRGLNGSGCYDAPEQHLGRPLDGRSDLFSLTVVLYELTTGRHLFRGTADQIASAIVRGVVPRPTVLQPGLPAGLEELIMTGLAPQPVDRLPNMAALRSELQRLAARHGCDDSYAFRAGFIQELNRSPKVD